MKSILFLNKKEGETPLEALELFRAKNKRYKDVKMTYAGRLDPMASGLLLVLVGDEIKNKEKYLALEKEYKFEILFGFSTDTYDILGKITPTNLPLIKGEVRRGYELQNEIENNLKFFTGKFIQKYPIYSSKTVNGKQLFEYAMSNIDVKIPEHEVFVKELKFSGLRKIKPKRLLLDIEKRIGKVNGPARNAKGIAFAGGDFRQKEILKIWRNKLFSNKTQYFFIGNFKIKCGSGTYVRGIADSLGEKIGIPALAFSIKRVRIGNYRQVR